jgi:hypothetical protein
MERLLPNGIARSRTRQTGGGELSGAADCELSGIVSLVLEMASVGAAGAALWAGPSSPARC